MQPRKLRFVSAGIIGLSLFIWTEKARSQVCDPPQVLIILDKSSSMNYVAGDGITPKWDVAVQAIGQVVGQYEGKIDFGLMIFPYPNQCAPGQVIVNVAPNNSSAVVQALGDPPPSGGNYTPMAQSLEEASVYAPLLDPSRRNVALLITDGWQWCYPHDPTTRFLPVGAVQGLTALGITTYVVGFGDGVDALTMNRMASNAGTAFPGCDVTSSDPADPDNCYFMADDLSTLTAALDQIAVAVTQEICDGMDNDCNGLTDDNLERPCETICGQGSEVCVNGSWVGCDAPLPQAEICDNLDNNCDGVIDEGCDCVDGETRPCGLDEGECRQGQQICQNGTWSQCIGLVGPTAEVCDNKDNDCNGLTDEELTRTCQTACGQGEEICIQGEWSGCTASQPTREICDGIDNDCNSLTDENLARPCQTACGQGQKTCNNGRWEGCTAPEASAEICDGKDNDCDGLVDNGANLCGPDGQCMNGQCVPMDKGGATADTPEACGCRLFSPRDERRLPLLVLLAAGLLGLLIRRRP